MQHEDYGRYERNDQTAPKVWTVDENRRNTRKISPREENSSFFSNTPRQQLEKYLAGSFILIAILCLGLSLSVFAGRRNDLYDDMCQTPQCIQSALVLLTSMNSSVDPCEDFYQFACGGYNIDFSDDTENKFVENWVTEQQKRQKKLFLKKLKEDNAPNDPSGIRAARRVFKACQNIPAINAVGLPTLWATLEKLGLPRHPLNTTGKEIPWTRALGRTLRYLAHEPIISFTEKPSNFNSNINLVTFITPDDSGDVGILGGWKTLRFFNHKMASSVKSVQNWNNYVGKIITYLIEADGTKIKENEQLTNVTDSILKVFRVIVRALETDNYPLDGAKADCLNCSAVQMNISEFQTILDNSTTTGISKIQLKPFLEEILSQFPEVKYDYSRELVIVMRLNYYRVLSSLMEQLTDEDIVLFIWWQAVSILAIHTNEDLMYLNDQLLRNLGDQYIWSRETVCYSNVFHLMKPSLVYFMLETINESRIDRVKDMAANIQKTLTTSIIHQDWMDEKTKKASANRMKSVQFHIGLPETMKNLSYFDELYRSRGENRPGVNEGQIPLYEFKHLENLQNLVDFEVKKRIKRLAISTAVDHGDFDPLLINAYHEREFNSVTIPLAILNLPIYGWGNDALNYGALGGFIGHEISHVFDTRGKTIDENGSIRPSWWSKSAVEEHDYRSSCFVQQYSKILLAKKSTVKINGNLTLDENIADSEGLKVAFKAFKSRKNRLFPDQKMPGLQYTQDQLFFLAFARAKCALYSKYAFSKVSEDVHAPDFLRVYATLRNSPDFSAAWTCPKGSFMNPKLKCRLWT